MIFDNGLHSHSIVGKKSHLRLIMTKLAPRLAWNIFYHRKVVLLFACLIKLAPRLAWLLFYQRNVFLLFACLINEFVYAYFFKR